MTAFLLGNLLGRLLFSAFAVWLVLLLMSKFNAKSALRRLRRPLPLLAVTAVFFLGLIGSAKAADDKQLFHVMRFVEAGLDDVYLPAEPRWDYQLNKRHSTHAVILSSPATAPHAAVLELVLEDRLRIAPEQLREVSAAATSQLKQQLGLREPLQAQDMQPLQYRDLSGWGHRFEHRLNGQDFVFEIELLRLPSGHTVTAFSSTQAQNHNAFVTTKAKILGRLKEL